MIRSDVSECSDALLTLHCWCHVQCGVERGRLLVLLLLLCQRWVNTLRACAFQRCQRGVRIGIPVGACYLAAGLGFIAAHNVTREPLSAWLVICRCPECSGPASKTRLPQKTPATCTYSVGTDYVGGDIRDLPAASKVFVRSFVRLFVRFKCPPN